MLPIYVKDHLLSASFFSEVDQIEEGSLSKAVQGDVSHPDEELLASSIHDARISPASLLSLKAYL